MELIYIYIKVLIFNWSMSKKKKFIEATSFYMGITLKQILLCNIVAITTSCNSKGKKVITFVFLNYCFNKYHFQDKLHCFQNDPYILC